MPSTSHSKTTTEQLEQAFSALSAQQQEVMRLRFKHGWGYTQIAAATGHSMSTVRFLTHSAFRTLGSRLSS